MTMALFHNNTEVYSTLSLSFKVPTNEPKAKYLSTWPPSQIKFDNTTATTVATPQRNAWEEQDIKKNITQVVE